MKTKVGIGYWVLGSWLRTTTHCFVPTVYFLAVLPITAQRFKNPKPHREDLTEHRLEFPEVLDSTIAHSDERRTKILPAAHSVNAKVDEVLDSLGQFNKTKMFTDGFTIQLYAGLKRDEAMNVKKRFSEEAKDLVAEFKYEQPKWRVKTGNYFTRLEAQRDLHRVKKIFPNAILIPEKVAMKW